jgi:hypothetical protein
MRKGSLPRSIGRVLPGPVGYRFAPDGLDEAAIDELIEQAYAQVDATPSRPGWLSSDLVEQRRARRKARQIMRVLPATLTQSAAGPDGGVAA